MFRDPSKCTIRVPLRICRGLGGLGFRVWYARCTIRVPLRICRV